MMSPEIYANDEVGVVSGYQSSGVKLESHNYKDAIDGGDRQGQHEQLQPHQRRHVHFNNYEEGEMEQQQSSGDDDLQQSQQSLEVSCEHNPTKLFLLMNQQVWNSALAQLHRNPIEAQTWICSFFPNSNEYKWRNLPLHLACLHGPDPVPLQFLQALIEVYPEAAQCRNNEGNLPIHLACECLDFGARFEMEVEAILITLIKAFPACLNMRDHRGRRPIDILDEKGIRLDNRRRDKDRPVGRNVGIIKYMRSQERKLEAGQNNEGDGTHLFNDDMNHGKRKLKRRPISIQVPDSGRDDHMVFEGEKIELRENSTLPPPRIFAKQTPSTDEKAFPSFHNRNMFQANSPAEESYSNDSSDDGGRRANNEHVQEPIMMQSFVSPTHSAAIISPHNINASMISPQNFNLCRSPIGHVDPFHHMESELSSMRHAHHSMSAMLSTKVQSESELRERLSRLEEEHAQLKNHFDELTHEHTTTVTVLKEKKTQLEHCNYELKIIKRKEKALSDELAFKMGIEEKQGVEINALKHELENERRERIAAEEKVECQMKMRAEWEETAGISKSRSEKMSQDISQLTMENKDMLDQLAKKNKQLQENKAKDATLLGLLSKMQSVDALEEKLDKANDANEKMKEENEKMSIKNNDLHKQLQDIKSRESKMKNLLGKVRDALEASQKENKQIQLQVVGQEKQLHETKIKEAKLVGELLEKKTLLGEVRNALQESQHANNELQNQMSGQDRQLQEAILKETKLNVDLLEKKGLIEEINDKLVRSQHEIKKLHIQVATQHKQLGETRAKEEKSVAELLVKEKLLESTNKALEQSQGEKQQLHIQIARQNQQLQEARTKEEKLMEDLLEKSQMLRKLDDKDGFEAEELRSKNLALREVALKAIEIMQQRIKKVQVPSSSDSINDTLGQLLRDVKSASLVGIVHSQKGGTLDACESLELLRPILSDARNLQQDTIERIQQLLEQSHHTKKLIEQISSISHAKFSFGSTLQILEDTLTSYVQILETLGTMLDINEKSKTRLASLLDRQPLGEIDNTLYPTKSIELSVESFDLMTFSLVKGHSTKMATITQKHLAKLENLSTTVGRLPQMKNINLDSDKGNVRQHLNMVDEITTVLHRALSNLAQDARQLKLVNDDIHTVCVNQSETKMLQGLS